MLASILVAALAATQAFASPVAERASSSGSSSVSITDVQILQYALTLEHLENAFYSGALSKFSQDDFVNAGLPEWSRKRIVEIGQHEASHVAFLEQAIGANATQPCNYTFPYTDPKSFTSLAQVLEGVGVTAYLGAAQYITNKQYLTAAGSILTTEARHAAWIASAVNKGAPWSGAFDTPLDFDEVYSLASTFITSCPTTNPTLPFKAFPALTVSPAAPASGSSVTLSYNSSGSSSGTNYLALAMGLSTIFIPIDGQSATLPQNITGTIYGVVTSSNDTVSDDTTVAGPVIFRSRITPRGHAFTLEFCFPCMHSA